MCTNNSQLRRIWVRNRKTVPFLPKATLSTSRTQEGVIRYKVYLIEDPASTTQVFIEI